MDQNSFRSLLTAPASAANASKSKAYNRGSLLASGSTASTKKPETSDSTFKPRKVKKPTDSKYRDRASERRGGVNDYAEVEGILQDFEQQTAGKDKDVVEEQRKYLGGDAVHTVLVKGLDFALLEQNRAREETREDLDEDLESAFFGKTAVTDDPPAPSVAPTNPSKKRTRAELLAELQRARGVDPDSVEAENKVKAPTRQEELEALERAKQAGRFKPMGSSSFAPVEKKKKKKKKVVTSGDGKTPETKDEKGKGKAKELSQNGNNNTSQDPKKNPENTPSSQGKSTQANGPLVDMPSQAHALPITPPPAAPALSLEDIEDVDPFAEAGDYQPDYGDDSEGDDDGNGGNDKKPKGASEPLSPSAPPVKRNWFNDPEPEPTTVSTKPPTPPANPTNETEEPDLPTAMRLESLSSSAMPSVSQFLAMDKEEEEREKKRARKEKKKKGGG